MPLPTIAELNELRKARDSRKEILSSLKVATSHSEDIRLHTEPNVSGVPSAAYDRFLSRIKGQLDTVKFKVFKKYHRFPMETTAMTSHILDQLSKVFEGKNAVRSVEYVSDTAKNIYSKYLKDTGFNSKWRTQSIRALGTGINSVLVVDMPKENPSDFSKPYFYFLDVSNIYDMDVDREGNILWLEYFREDEVLVHISKGGWQLLEVNGKSGDVVKIVHEAQNPTERYLCRFWWEPEMKAGNKILKLSPFSEWVTKLDGMESWSVFKNMLDSFGSNPVTWSIEEDCDFTDKVRGVHCDGGYLKTEAGAYLRGMNVANGSYESCPQCGDRRFVGPGSHIEIPAPSKEDGDFRAPFGVVGIDKEALDNAREELIRKNEEIVSGITGGSKPIMDEKAVNIPQVKAFFEGWTGVLRKIKKSFESSEEWLIETMAALMFGGEAVEASLNYGTSFYLQSEEEALIFYTATRNAGLPDYILDFLLNEYYETKFKDDRKSLERVLVLMNVEPLKHITKTAALELSEKGLVSDNEVRVKLNFGSLVQRFEMENGPVSEFGVNMSGEKSGGNFATRVNKIRETLVSYLPEIKEAAVEE